MKSELEAKITAQIVNYNTQKEAGVSGDELKRLKARRDMWIAHYRSILGEC